jgi:pimeloyl-ACP methyl ester carboxylesterase
VFVAARQHLLLIPGLVCDAEVWRYPAKHLADLAEVSIPPAAQGETMADIARIALEAAPDKFALAGFSMGGYVALEMLRQAPERVTRLALVDSSARADTPEKAESRRVAIAACERGEFAAVIDRMMPILLHSAHQSGPLPAFVRDMVGRVGPEVFVRRMRAIAGRQDSRELLRKTRQPVRALCGREDAMTAIEDHVEIAELAPNGRFSLIEECGHMTVIERPQAVTALLRDWLVYG